MLARHWRLLSVFAGGCLSGGMLITGWRSAPEPSSSSVRRAEPQNALLFASATDDNRHVASPESSPEEEVVSPTPPLPAAPKAAEHAADSAATEAGRSVAEVLLHLEAAYRETLPPAAPTAEAAAPIAAPSTPVAEPPQAPPVALVAAVAPVVAPAATAPVPAAVAPLPAAPARALVEPVAAPVVATRAPTPVAAPGVALPTQIGTANQVGIATQNVQVGDVHYGDSYQVQQIVQYVPMYAPFPYAGYGAYAAPVPTPHGGASKRVPYPGTLTNPENPWGYSYPSALWTVR